jgi:hypothetical protein
MNGHSLNDRKLWDCVKQFLYQVRPNFGLQLIGPGAKVLKYG